MFLKNNKLSYCKLIHVQGENEIFSPWNLIKHEISFRLTVDGRQDKSSQKSLRRKWILRCQLMWQNMCGWKTWIKLKTAKFHLKYTHVVYSVSDLELDLNTTSATNLLLLSYITILINDVHLNYWDSEELFVHSVNLNKGKQYHFFVYINISKRKEGIRIGPRSSLSHHRGLGSMELWCDDDGAMVRWWWREGSTVGGGEMTRWCVDAICQCRWSEDAMAAKRHHHTFSRCGIAIASSHHSTIEFLANALFARKLRHM